MHEKSICTINLLWGGRFPEGHFFGRQISWGAVFRGGAVFLIPFTSPTVLSTSERKSVFAWRFTQKK